MNISAAVIILLFLYYWGDISRAVKLLYYNNIVIGGRAHSVFPPPPRTSLTFIFYQPYRLPRVLTRAAVLHVFHFRRHVQTWEIWRRQADGSAAHKCHVPGRRTAAAGLRSDRALAQVQSGGAPRADTSAHESICPVRLRRVFTFLRRPSVPVIIYWSDE